MTNGVIFVLPSSGVALVRLRLTKRSDLALDRMTRGRSDIVAVIEAPTWAFAGMMRRVLEQVFGQPGTGGGICDCKVPDAIARCRGMGFKAHILGDKPKRPIAEWQQPIITTRWVPDPSMTRALLLQELEKNPDKRWAGYHRADVSLRELIGGLAGVRKRTEVQTQAAAEFRNLAERAQLGAGKGTDYTDVRVDVSAHAGNPVAEIGQEAREKYGRARRRLGDLASLAERVIVDGDSISETAERLGFGKSGAARDRLTRMTLKATDVLAAEFGFVAKGKPGGGVTNWADGSPQSFTTNGADAVISTRASRDVG